MTDGICTRIWLKLNSVKNNFLAKNLRSVNLYPEK